MGHKIKMIIITLLLALSMSGCTAAVLIPPLSGPLFVPSTASSAYQIYKVSTDERDLQTIIEDEYIESRIHASILDDSELELLELSPYSYNGHIYVVGKFDDKKDFGRISRIVRNSGKVNSLTTYLYPEKENPACNEAEDMILATKVKAALMENRNTRGINIAVKAVQCNVVLLGRVSSPRDIDAVTSVAAYVEGAKSVKSFIRPTNRHRYRLKQRKVALSK